jgi:hypothetical protein
MDAIRDIHTPNKTATRDRPLEGRPSISLDTESAHEIAVFGKSFHVRMQRFLGMAAEAQYAEV